MASIISSGTTSGTALNMSGDTSGVLQLATNGTTTALTLDASQNATFAGSVKTNTLTSAAATALTLQSAGTTAITVDTSQNVGIGTSSPSQILDIVGTTPIINIQGGATTNARGLQFKYGASITTGSLTNFGGTGETALSGGTTGSSGYFLTFKTDGTERMRIDSSGNLLVGKTSVGTTNTGFEVTPAGGGSGQPRISLTSSGTSSSSKIVFYNNSGTYCGEIFTGSGTSTTYSNASDYRLKEDIQPMQGSLSKVMALKPVTYKWKSDGSIGEGFIAHELQEIIPSAVSKHKDAVDVDGNPEYQGIDQSKLVATLTAALQETKALIDTQAETINALTARIVALEQA